MFVIPLGVAVAVFIGLAIAFILLLQFTRQTVTHELIEASVAAVMVLIAIMVFLGAFHRGPLYQAPAPVHRGRSL